MPELEQLRENLADVSERLRAKTRAYDEATSARDQIQRQVKQLRARREQAQEEAEAEAFLPGRENNPTAVAARTRSEVEELDRRIEEAENRIERLKQEKDALREEQQEAARKVARALVRPVVAAEEQRREALARLASAVLPAFADYLEATAERTDAERELKSAVGTAAATSNQKRQLQGYLRQELEEEELPAEVLLGRLLADVLNWSRRIGTGPVPEVLREAEIPLLDESPRHGRPVPALENTVAWLEQGRLPDSPSII